MGIFTIMGTIDAGRVEPSLGGNCMYIGGNPGADGVRACAGVGVGGMAGVGACAGAGEGSSTSPGIWSSDPGAPGEKEPSGAGAKYPGGTKGIPLSSGSGAGAYRGL